MKGFKSFADKTVIDFKSGISCIIGPNGSGKSNITDALKWVLGEQKISMLRGNSMKDVIFKGSEHRKPLGRAEISLYFDNSDNFFSLEYDVVKITRRLFMSGESEYLINDTKIRLKDVRELIMDTGIASDGYSIISQGKINTMITANKDDIRLVLEEASGITKFKTRKRESQRKLEKTTINLERIEDIVFELGKRIEPLKKESEKAIEYKENYENLKRIELSTFSKNIYKSNFDEKLINKKITDLLIIKDHKSNYYNSLKKNSEKTGKKINEKSKEIKEIEKKYYEFNEEISLAKNSYNIGEERISNSSKNSIEIKAELKYLEEKIVNLKKVRETFVENKKEVENEIFNKSKFLDSENKDLREDINLAEKIVKDNIRINDELLISDKNFNENSLIISSKNEIIIQLNLMIIDIKKEINEIQNVNNENVGLINKINKKNNSLIDEELSENNNKKEIINELNILNNKKEKISKNMIIVKDNLNSEITEHKLLKTYEDNFIGYFQPVKQLMTSIKNKELEEGVHGVVGSLMNVKKEYLVAIEIALGSSMQNVVCDNINNAKKLINHLKKSNYGRVSFLPLSNLFVRKDNNQILDKVKTVDNYLGKANEIISYDGKYNNLFNYLLGNVLVVKDYDAAKKMLNIANIRYKIVTLEGEVFSQGGRITGGSYASKSKGLLGRKRKIEELFSSIKNKTKIKNNYEAETDKMDKVIINEKEKLLLINEKINKLKNEKFEIRSKLNYLDDKLVDFDAEFNKKIKNKLEINRKIILTENEIELLKNENLKTSEKINDLKIKLSDNSLLDNLNDNIEVRKSKIIELKIESASLNEKYENYKFNEAANIKDIKEMSSTISSKYDLFNRFKENIEKQKNSNESFKKNIFNLVTTKEKFNISLEIEKNNLFEYEKSRKNIEENINKIIDSLTYINEKLSNYKIEKAKISVNIKKIKEDLWQKYEMSYLEILDYKYDDSLVIESNKKLNELRRNIKRLGNVNLNSIDEYDEVKERFEYLSAQQDDLKKAKKALDKIIKDLEKKMEKQFIVEIESISNYFKEVFKVLFNGGKADIIIEDMDAILESEIRIMAQPPGKKLQSLSLLSGGEKALTAISLLFAILKNKPAPFCVLDEIEAALDDVNVFRFADYLKKIETDSQFIVITHRKGTMEVADCLYGVTMEEKGVSKIVSLELENIEKEMV
jgi:chromosome segregation protein